MHSIPVVDLFAGPGGLSHGFSSLKHPKLGFDMRLSIEMDHFAYQTLTLRAFVRQFSTYPPEYYDYIQRRNVSRSELERKYPAQWKRAYEECKKWELGKIEFATLHAACQRAIGRTNQWVLLGGPPCQAYSLAGRSRMKNRDAFPADARHTLYREYLKIVATLQPAVFVMENVKGILSSKHGTVTGESPIVLQILEDLKDPSRAVRSERDVAAFIPTQSQTYRIHSFVVRSPSGWGTDFLTPENLVIRSEDWGVPQKRHRVILLGVRADLDVEPVTLGDVFENETSRIEDVIGTMPRIRSRISRRPDRPEEWLETIQDAPWASILEGKQFTEMLKLIERNSARLSAALTTGSKFIEKDAEPKRLAHWLSDPALDGIIQHDSRSHMQSDLVRYFYASCAASESSISPKLKSFPADLLPAHRNASKEAAQEKGDFGDRFRVQVKGKPATTIMSHISKDGHYYIHYDPLQCRSLTVREAARIQTFPDSYFFEGERTEQFHQVGNAVPPYLAAKLAVVVADTLVKSNGERSYLGPVAKRLISVG